MERHRGPVRCGVIDRVRLGAGSVVRLVKRDITCEILYRAVINQAEGQVSVVVGEVAARGLNIDNVAKVIGVPVPSALAARLIVGAVTPASAGRADQLEVGIRQAAEVHSLGEGHLEHDRVGVGDVVTRADAGVEARDPLDRADLGVHRIDRATAGVGVG